MTPNGIQIWEVGLDLRLRSSEEMLWSDPKQKSGKETQRGQAEVSGPSGYAIELLWPKWNPTYPATDGWWRSRATASTLTVELIAWVKTLQCRSRSLMPPSPSSFTHWLPPLLPKPPVWAPCLCPAPAPCSLHSTHSRFFLPLLAPLVAPLSSRATARELPVALKAL